MAIDKLKVMLSFMREIDDGTIPNANDYELDKEGFGSIIEACQDEGLIKSAIIQRAGQGNKVIFIVLDQVKLTVKGMEYLHNNSKLMKTYKGIKEIKDWIPFI